MCNPKLRATEQRAGVGHQGAPKKRPGTAIWGGPRYWPVPARAARPILRATEQRAGGGPKKAAWDRYLGAEIPARAHAHCQTEIVGLGAARW